MKRENLGRLLFAISLALAFVVLVHLRVAPFSLLESTTKKTLESKDDCKTTNPFNIRNQSRKDWKSNESSQKTKTSPGITAICSRFEAGQTTASVWRSHLKEILEAAIGGEKQQVHRGWLKELFHLLSSGNIMERGLRSAPKMATMENILTKVGERLTRNKNDLSSSPLQVVIFGDSVTEGSGCNILSPEINSFLPNGMGDRGGSMTASQCAWPTRLQLLVDAVLRPGIIQIHNFAVGGTDTLYSLPMLEYRLYPPNLDVLRKQGADIIVNAYSVIDNLYSWDGSEIASADLRHFHACLHKTKAFYHSALKSQSCPPLILFLDQYIGNLNNWLLGEDILNDVVRTFADAATDIGYISSALVARHLVYANTNETVFTPDWLKVPQHPEVHFYMPGHQHVAWVLAYSVLKSVMELCEDINDDETTLRGDGIQTNGLQPNIASKIDETKSRDVLHCNNDSATSSKEPCVFAFVATLAGSVTTKEELDQYIKPFKIQSSNGWEGEDTQRDGWRKKLGFVAHTAGASVGFSFPNLNNNVRIITIHYLKSYGELWENSEAVFSFTVSDSAGRPLHEVSFNLTGHHKEQTSLTFPFTIDLGEKYAEVGQTALLNITLVSGKRFKIQSLMLCSR